MGISSICGDQGICSTKTASIVLASVAGVAILVAGVALVAIFVAPVAAILGLGALALSFGAGVSALLAITCGIGAVYLFLKGETIPASPSGQLTQPQEASVVLPRSVNPSKPLGRFNLQADIYLALCIVDFRNYYILNPTKYKDVTSHDISLEVRSNKINGTYSIGSQSTQLSQKYANKADLNAVLKAAKMAADQVEKTEVFLIACDEFHEYVSFIFYVEALNRYKLFVFNEGMFIHELQTILEKCEKALGYELTLPEKSKLFAPESLATLKAAISTK